MEQRKTVRSRRYRAEEENLLLDRLFYYEQTYAELPTFSDIAQCTKIRPTALLDYLREAEKRGWITRLSALRPVRYAAGYTVRRK